MPVLFFGDLDAYSISPMRGITVGLDDGCRLRNCDFGRGPNGWCEPPAEADPPII